MAWTELTELRQRNSRTYQNDANPLQRHIHAPLCPLHYESTIDSGVHDAEIDFSLVRVNNAQLDGWVANKADWHYALGQPSDKPTDGWVGFGGRAGQNWVKFQLLRVGYLRWNTRAWQDIGGAPTYNRANLSSETRQRALWNGETVNVESVARWNGLWTTPGGGSLDVSWRVNGDKLKEEITINQAAREWITANRPPSTPATQTWFGFVFQVDWSDVPALKRAGIQQDMEGDFADDGEPIELRDALDRLLGFMPLDNVTVQSTESSAALRKRFWKDGDGNTYLLVGVRCDALNGLPAGDLVFDPTYTVAASADDAVQADVGSTATITRTAATIANPSSAGIFIYGGFRWTVTGPASGDTIDTANIEVRDNLLDDPDVNIDFEASDNAAQFAAATNDLSGRALTGNAVTWTETDAGVEQFIDSPSLVTPLQAVINRGGWASGNAVVAIFAARSASQVGIRMYDGDAAYGATLNITYTAAGGGATRTATPITTALKGTFTRTISTLTAALKYTGTRTASSVTAALAFSATRTITPVTAALSGVFTRTASSVTAALSGTLTRTASSVSSTLKYTGTRTVGRGAELLSNGGFETAGAGGADVFGSWTEVVSDGAIADETTLVHGDGHAIRITAGVNRNTECYQTVNVAPSHTYPVSFWTRGDGANAGRYFFYDVTNGAYITGVTSTGVAGTSYQRVSTTLQAPSNCTQAALYLQCPNIDGGVAYFDDVSAKERTLTAALRYIGTRSLTPITAALKGSFTRTATVSAALSGVFARTATPITVSLVSRLSRTASSITASLKGTLTRTVSSITAALVSTFSRTATPITVSLSMPAVDVLVTLTASRALNVSLSAATTTTVTLSAAHNINVSLTAS